MCGGGSLSTAVFTSNNHSGAKRGKQSGLIKLNVSMVKRSDDSLSVV